MLQHSVGKLVELIDKISNVDATHGVGLREWHRLWKVLPTQVSYDPSTRSKFTLLNAQALLWVASILPTLDRTPLDQSPSWADHRPRRQSDQSLPRTFATRVPSNVQTR
jgi:hypothetical protein